MCFNFPFFFFATVERKIDCQECKFIQVIRNCTIIITINDYDLLYHASIMTAAQG